MKIIQKVLSSMRNAELNNVVSKIIGVFSADLLTKDTALAGVVNEITTLNQALNKSINKDKALSDLEHLDDLRDNDFRAIVALTDG
ncbi:hypothetical protein [Saccharicrinis aurantiacus]|uniref:hypothetical protein n=1 Tax=Saccharicrinis aurantiacus TaxID=1849719 RepID=UPI00094FD940|nr:hypothetical protein [Saccharicrinis aurantiacus]